MGHSRRFDPPPTTSGLPRQADMLGACQHNIDFCANRGVRTGYACSPVEIGQFRSTSFSLAALLNGTLHVYMNATQVESAATDLRIVYRYRQVGQCIRSF